MATIPEPVRQFLAAGRIAVAGVSRAGNQPANAILARLRSIGADAVAVNPNAAEIGGVDCYPDLASVPGTVGSVMVVTHPNVSVEIVRQAAARGVRHVWFHRSVGDGSVSADALRECEAHGIEPIVGGCPMMYCGSVDIAHRCFRWWLGLKKRVPV